MTLRTAAERVVALWYETLHASSATAPAESLGAAMDELRDALAHEGDTSFANDPPGRWDHVFRAINNAWQETN